MKKQLLLPALVLALISACTWQEIDLVPFPNSITFRSGIFDVTKSEVVCAVNADNTTLNSIAAFAEDIGSELIVSGTPSNSDFVFLFNASLPEEKYLIDVTRKGVRVEASGLRGFNYAIQSLKQMGSRIPCCHIEDSPRFSYRGLHLDEARHFFGKETVKKYLDIMAYHKLNTFHWHLTDDQGWRIEIKKYPELTMLGSIRKGTCIKRNYNTNDNVPYGEGMWYTQDQIREIVSYASSKGITVIPEIDLPGHMMGALAAYPELGCTGGPYDVMCKWGISEDVLCAGRDENYLFLENVLEEVCELFPSEYIHIGGDECPKTRWEKCPRCQAKIKELGLEDDQRHSAEHYLQSHVMKQMAEFLASKGKRIIGWEEMLQGELAPGATVMAWRRNKYGHQAARLGHDAIMTTRTNLYFDRYQSEDKDNEPLAHSSYLPVEMVWSYDPYLSEDKNAEPLTQEQKEHIIGIQANVWREYIPTDSHLEYMVCPRISALAEVQWLMPEGKDWERFRRGMDRMRKVYEVLGCSYATHFWQSEQELE